MQALVTGIGYLGAQLVGDLLRAGHRVVGVDNLFSTDLKAIEELQASPRFLFVQGDAASTRVIGRAFAAAEHVDVVFSLAAQASADPRASGPLFSERTNLTGPRVLLDACVKHGVRDIVYASSMRVYGEPLPRRVDELSSVGIFADLPHLSKCYVEKLLEMYAHRHGLRCLSLRLAVLYGVGPVMKEDPRFLTVPHRFCLQASRGLALTVHDGSRFVPFMHVADASRSLLVGLGHSEFDGFTPLNAATEVLSLAEVAGLVGAACLRRGLPVPAGEASPIADRPSVHSRLAECGFAGQRLMRESLDDVLGYFLDRGMGKRA